MLQIRTQFIKWKYYGHNPSLIEFMVDETGVQCQAHCYHNCYKILSGPGLTTIYCSHHSPLGLNGTVVKIQDYKTLQ